MTANIIPWGISFVMLLFSIFTYVRSGGNDKVNKQKEDDFRLSSIQSDVSGMTFLLKTVNETINDIRSEIKEMTHSIGDHATRIGIIEADLKSIHQQIDDIKSRLE